MLALSAENSIIIGNISDTRYVFPYGQVPGELLLLSNVFSVGDQKGLPVLNTEGMVIGMILSINSSIRYNIALSEFFMRRPIKALISIYQNNTIAEHYKGFIEQVFDPLGNYYKYNKSTLGLGCVLVTQEDYNTNIIYNSSYIRIPYFDTDMKLTDGPHCKEIVGYRVLIRLIPDLLNDVINIGDIITHINECPLGDRKGQISPSLVMWRVKPGELITMTYKKQTERFATSYTINVETKAYDALFDYPFYSEEHSTFRLTI